MSTVGKNPMAPANARTLTAPSLEAFERQYLEMFGGSAAQPTDRHDLAQPDPRTVVQSVTTHGAYDVPIRGIVQSA